jgi:ABC-type polar amino acid transport system ATPase subunit
MTKLPAPPADALLTAAGLVKKYGDRVIINSIDLSVRPGETVVFIGPSGTGKSTLLRCINGLESIQGGRIEFDGQEIVKDRPDIVMARRKIGMIFQNFNLYPHLTALRNITLVPERILGRPRADVESEARQLLQRIRLEHRAHAFPAQLSGGEQQRVAIARALAMRPKMLMFDEATSALDPETVGDVLAVMSDLAREGQTMLVVTHEIGFAREVGTRLVFMDGGKIVEEGEPKAMIDKPSHERTSAFLSSIWRH